MAIIVSVAMVTAVFTSAISFIKYFQNATIAVDGNWHADFTDPHFPENEDKYKASEDIVKYGAHFNAGTAVIKEKNITADIKAAQGDYWELRNIKATQGVLPQKSDEMLVSAAFLKKEKLDWKVGERITLSVSDGKNPPVQKVYKITAICESGVSALDGNILRVGADSGDLAGAENVSVLVRYDKLNGSIWEKMENTQRTVSAVGYNWNTELFAYSYVLRDNYVIQTFTGFGSVILLIIIIVSVFMIYDSFAVSYQERSKYLGMLASVGATKKQKRASVYFEGLIFGLIGIPLGIAAGIGGIAVTFKCIEKVFISTLAVDFSDSLKVYINWIVIVGTIVISGLTILISAYIPARKASKTTPIDAIRQNDTYRAIKPRALKTSRLVEKLLGYEGVMAVKNYKRNGKRSKTIVGSLALSVIVFLSVANFSLMFDKAMNNSFDYSAKLTYSVDYSDLEELNDALGETEEIRSSYTAKSEYASLDKKYFTDEALKYHGNDKVHLIFLDRISFDSYLRQLGENPSDYHDLNDPRAVIYDVVTVSQGMGKKNIEALNIPEGERLELKAGSDVFIQPIRASAGIVTDEEWKRDYFPNENMNTPLIILPLELVEKICADGVMVTEFIDCGIPDAVSERANEILENNGVKYEYSDIPSQLESINNILTIVKVFVFGFITLITLISIMNIINTISNSMNERRREFAMVRSVGMTPAGFRKMIYYESFRYGVVALLWALPISAAIHAGMYYTLSLSWDGGFDLNILFYLAASVGVFVIIALALMYSVGKVKNDNIIENLE